MFDECSLVDALQEIIDSANMTSLFNASLEVSDLMRLYWIMKKS
jgi:hypothetical protein